MVTDPPFERSVFINCPFDDEFSEILQAIAFCVTLLGFFPRIAPENSNGSATRLDRIVELIRGSKYSIHDLSRCKSTSTGEYSRLNMPFELGIDYGASKFGAAQITEKSVLILEETRYDYQKALSDIAGWDIEPHDGDHQGAVRKVALWLIRHAGATPIGATAILDQYTDFQAWYWDREIGRGASEDDIKTYPTIHFVHAMQEWVTTRKPL